MSRFKLLLYLVPVIWFILLISCSSDATSTNCETDQDCPNGQYCGEDKICHKGTKPIKDAGFDAGRDAGRDTGVDAGKDVGKDIETDTTEIPDIYEDIETDVWEDAITDISPDAYEDVGEDATTDISDISGDTYLRVFIPSFYDMSVGITSTDDYNIKSVTGMSARPVINTNEVKVYNNKTKTK